MTTYSSSGSSNSEDVLDVAWTSPSQDQPVGGQYWLVFHAYVLRQIPHSFHRASTVGEVPQRFFMRQTSIQKLQSPCLNARRLVLVQASRQHGRDGKAWLYSLESWNVWLWIASYGQALLRRVRNNSCHAEPQSIPIISHYDDVLISWLRRRWFLCGSCVCSGHVEIQLPLSSTHRERRQEGNSCEAVLTTYQSFLTKRSASLLCTKEPTVSDGFYSYPLLYPTFFLLLF